MVAFSFMQTNGMNTKMNCLRLPSCRVKGLLWAAMAAVTFSWQCVTYAGDQLTKEGAIKIPPQGQLYHGVHAAPSGPGGTMVELDAVISYEQTVGKTAAWIDFTDDWSAGGKFPAETAQWIRQKGSVPYIRFMLPCNPQEKSQKSFFILDTILKGTLDDDVRRWARGAKDFGTPLIAEFGTEVNGEWCPWNGRWNGGAEVRSYGDPLFPNGPERFRDAYRHLIAVMRQEQAFNITWVFHVNYNDCPAESWNRFENYYPGDDCIDMIGVSIYGAQSPLGDEWPEFTGLFDALYPRIIALAPQKPILITEFGVTRDNPRGSQSQWAQRALTGVLSRRWPGVIGFAWWNKAWQNDRNPHHDTSMRVQDNPALVAVFRELIGNNPRVLGTIDCVDRGHR